MRAIKRFSIFLTSRRTWRWSRGRFVDYRIVDEKEARKHIKLSKRNNDLNPYEVTDLNYADIEIFKRKHTELEIIASATKNYVEYLKAFKAQRQT